MNKRTTALRFCHCNKLAGSPCTLPVEEVKGVRKQMSCRARKAEKKLRRAQTSGGLVHEDDGGVGDQLNGNGEALALLHAEPGAARDAHQRVPQRRQLHQAHHL